MTPQQEQQVLASLYDRIFDAVTYDPSGQAAGQAKPRMLMAKSMVLNPADFTNALSPLNPSNAQQTAAQAFSALVDALPQNLPSLYVASGETLSKNYITAVKGANAQTTENPEQQKIYNQAYNYLNTTTTVIDFMDQKQTTVGPSAIYKAYQNNQAAYLTAVGGYRTAYNGYDLSKPADQRAWNAVQPSLQNTVTQAWNTWEAQGKAQVEQALAALASTINNALRQAIAADQALVAPGNQLPSTDGIGTFLLSYALPSNWCDASSQAAQLSLKSSYLNKSASTEATSYSAGANANWGLWSAGGSFSKDDQSNHSHMDTSDFELTAELIRVEIKRPWFDPLLLSMKGWYADGFGVGGLSDAMPLFPTAFIVARNVTITANFSQQDEAHLSQMTSSSAEVGWGPFSVKGSYANSTSNDSFTSSINGGSLKLPGLQLIAFLCATTPSSPPLAAPGM